MKWWCLLLAPAALAQTAAPAGAAPADAAALMRASIERQRAAARMQAQTAGARLLPYSSMPAAAPLRPAARPCDAVSADALTPMLEAAASSNRLSVDVLRAVIEEESASRPCAVSSKGAQGLMQIMPDTAADLGLKNPFDPAQNITAGARYLKQLLDKYHGAVNLALAAYNAGPANVTTAVPDIPETREYVAAILKKLKADR